MPSNTPVRAAVGGGHKGRHYPDASRILGLVLAFGVAAVCFWITRNLSLEWSDEGHIIYPIWRVAEGALPYVDVRQLYAPSVFFLNAALLRLFGTDLAVIRVSLVLAKAALAILVYLNAREIAARRFALLAYAFIVVVWMTPWWVFNSPYANHYALLLELLGIFGFVKLRARRFVPACAWIGLCFGVATTFKQTSGTFAFISFALFLLWDEEAGASIAQLPAPSMDVAARALRWVTLLGAVGVCAAYLAPRNSPWNLALLLPPVGACVLAVGRRELRAVEPRQRLGGAIGILSAGLAMALPPAVYAVYYASRGQLPALLADTMIELPRRTNWFDPLPVPALRPLALTAALAALLMAARFFAPADRPGAEPGRRRWRAAALSLGVGYLWLVVYLADIGVSVGIDAYLQNRLWYHDVFGTLYVLPFAVVWGALWLHLRETRRPAATVEVPAPAATLWSFFAAFNLLLFYPAGDFWHLLMILPAFLPLFAYLAQRYASAPSGGAARIRWLPSLAVLGLVVALCAPFVQTLRGTLALIPGLRGGFARASGVLGWPPKAGEAIGLMAYLAVQPPDARLLVLCNEQMLYFLAGRPSALERDEFVLYLVGTGAIEPHDAHALVTESQIIARLEEIRPLVIDCPGSPAAERFKDMFPEVARRIATHYDVAATFGGYQALAWSTPANGASAPGTEHRDAR